MGGFPPRIVGGILCVRTRRGPVDSLCHITGRHLDSRTLSYVLVIPGSNGNGSTIVPAEISLAPYGDDRIRYAVMFSPFLCEDVPILTGGFFLE